MTFVNEKMSAEEKAEFEARKIPKPGNVVATLKPSQWTINREENVMLIWSRMEYEEPSRYYFLLVWKGINIPVQLSQSWENDSPIVWELISIKIPDNLQEKKDNVIQSLKEALKVYAIDGSPYGRFNQPIEVQCNF